ncbi:DNA translocase FtsK [Parageobacillus thermoglucosidasius]|uniref:Cell division protein FtsK n=1 Tax=Parageobacillus thermoglucosidasius TaxID=1426 RepID=A0AAN0YN61_PARTM|nr:DNA translocase FtsK [Parageobacillus thermoglucosidasius]ALF10209.1 cell division protein FtsK [Parageobacillus thermoglucosidasius]ANZ30292.1 cell division protein FtsK [Parageobacillus thermoglucosidasius]APM81030.1 cell division protein FtsK [Parageobacillus thermoglucosidasius]KJX70745.1 cell division protein FtsK [Parageobacillus thermoglucosidasius]OUM85248.1 MAG: cell division protein FtsK [Parageobacillus thermoglucosidasius]
MVAKRKRQKKARRSKQHWKETFQLELIGLAMLAISVIAMARLGLVGKTLVFIARFFFGEWYMLLFVALFLLSFYVIWKRRWPSFTHRVLLGSYIIISSLLLLSHETLFALLSRRGQFDPSIIRTTWELFWDEVRGKSDGADLGGGMIGAFFFAASYQLFDELGTKWICFFLFVIGMVFITGKPLRETVGKAVAMLVSFLQRQWQTFVADVKHWGGKAQKRKRRKPKTPEPTAQQEGETLSPPPIISDFTAVRSNEIEQEREQEKAESAEEEESPPLAFSEMENADYQLPPLDLLRLPKQTSQAKDHANIYANARKLEKTFQSFGVKAKVTQVHLGPAVTKYEVYPDVGVKVSKIVSLSDDLALALAAKDIRIEAPIPGKSAIGIEVPNEEIATVSLREVLEAIDHYKQEAKLLIPLGRDISGEVVVAELNKMPHLLIAGATGSGKSVCINGIIVSLLMRTKPHEVKLMMIDPKMVELSVYNGIPHLLAPVVTNPKKASQALKKVVQEMERRYELFSHTGTRNIEGYNEYVRRHNQEAEEQLPLLPYIVVIIDELADLMMVASSDVEDSITRLAQMARAAGIHLIIATQRPSVDVITGVIKANIPSRIAFSVSSQTDSRTILDMGGAEKLLGRGDMLFLPMGASKPVRVQGAFVSDEEVEEVVDFVISQQKAQYYEEMIINEENNDGEEFEDELYEEAVRLVVEMQSASVSMLQRRFRIGYNRAARLIDAMEARGVVGPYEGSKPRAVLIPKENVKTS